MDLQILKILRKAKGLTQKEVGKIMGCTQAYISQVERGNRNDLRIVERMCTEYGYELTIIKRA